jgi:hypothetical protein
VTILPGEGPSAYITNLINNGGNPTIEYLNARKVTAVAFDEGGTILKGK